MYLSNVDARFHPRCPGYWVTRGHRRMYTRVKWSLLTDESVLEAYLLFAYERLLGVPRRMANSELLSTVTEILRVLESQIQPRIDFLRLKDAIEGSVSRRAMK
jgi:hypothetical protein